MLYQALEQKYGEDKAHDMWTAIRTQQFANKHGDWTAVTFSSNEAEVTAKIAQSQETMDSNQATLNTLGTDQYKELASIEKPSMKLALIPSQVLIDSNDASNRIAHDKIVKEATALQQLMNCL